MKPKHFTYILIVLLTSLQSITASSQATITQTISYNNVTVDVVMDKPAGNELDVLLLYHGTVWTDNKIAEAAKKTLESFKNILDKKDLLLISVAYPEENLLMGDNIRQAEAALLWVKNKAAAEMGITVKKIFLAGHSQGGYLVTRLNTLHPTDGVIANAPGPLNLVYRCQLEENGNVPASATCTLLKDQNGNTTANPAAYHERSLLNFTSGFKADILFVQGMDDAPIQMHSWPLFKEKILTCTGCKETRFLELPGYKHAALFNSPEAKTAFNEFINSRR